MECHDFELYLVIKLSDVFLYVWQQASESELLNELSDMVVVIQGQTGPVAPCSPRHTVWISCTSLQIRADGTEGMQASCAAWSVQLERMAYQSVGHVIW